MRDVTDKAERVKRARGGEGEMKLLTININSRTDGDRFAALSFTVVHQRAPCFTFLLPSLLKIHVL